MSEDWQSGGWEWGRGPCDVDGGGGDVRGEVRGCDDLTASDLFK